MEALAERLTIYIIEQGIVDEDDYAMYKYGLQTGLEMGSCVLASALIAIYLKSFMEFLVVIFVFFPLRAYVGGIHMKHFYLCFLCSCITITVGLLVARISVELDWKIFAGIIIIMFVIHKLAFFTTGKQAERKAVLYYALQRKRIFITIGLFAYVLLCMNLQKMLMLVFYVLVITLGTVILETLRYRSFIKKRKLHLKSIMKEKCKNEKVERKRGNCEKRRGAI